MAIHASAFREAPLFDAVWAVYTTAEAVRVEVTVQPDPEAEPWWLGRRVKLPGRNVVNFDGLWFEPHVELPRGYGRPGERGRRVIPAQVREDYARWRDYGRTWSLYRMTVAVTAPGQAPRSETVGGLAAHAVPIHSRLLLDQMVAGLLGRASV